MSEKLLCKDCKHSFVPFEQRLLHLGIARFIDAAFYKCRLTRKETHIEFNPVTGPKRIDTGYDACHIARLRLGPCGEEGKNWVPKHKKHLFLAITRGET